MTGPLDAVVKTASRFELSRCRATASPSTVRKSVVTAVGGLYEKIKAAETWSFKKVVVPQKNFEYSLDTKDYKIEVVPAKTLDDYLKECLI